MSENREVRRQNRRAIRKLLPVIGARYGLSAGALRVAMNSALENAGSACACLKAIERSLVPR